MIQSDYITVDEAPELMKDWECGFSGTSYFKKGSDCSEWQAYWLEDDKLVSFVHAFSGRIPVRLTRKQYEELFSGS